MVHRRVTGIGGCPPWLYAAAAAVVLLQEVVGLLCDHVFVIDNGKSDA